MLLEVTAEVFREGMPWQPGASALLDEVRAAGLSTALVTATYRSLVEIALETLGRDRFDVLVCGDEVRAPEAGPGTVPAGHVAAGRDRGKFGGRGGFAQRLEVGRGRRGCRSWSCPPRCRCRRRRVWCSPARWPRSTSSGCTRYIATARRPTAQRWRADRQPTTAGQLTGSAHRVDDHAGSDSHTAATVPPDDAASAQLPPTGFAAEAAAEAVTAVDVGIAADRSASTTWSPACRPLVTWVSVVPTEPISTADSHRRAVLEQHHRIPVVVACTALVGTVSTPETSPTVTATAAPVPSNNVVPLVGVQGDGDRVAGGRAAARGVQHPIIATLPATGVVCPLTVTAAV